MYLKFLHILYKSKYKINKLKTNYNKAQNSSIDPNTSLHKKRKRQEEEIEEREEFMVFSPKSFVSGEKEAKLALRRD